MTQWGSEGKEEEQLTSDGDIILPMNALQWKAKPDLRQLKTGLRDTS